MWESGKTVLVLKHSANTRMESVGSKRLTFVRNRGELAEGWYDPATLQKAQASAASNSEYVQSRSQRGDSPSHGSHMKADESSDEDLVGPTLPGEVQVYKNSKRPGPAIPNSQELQLRRGLYFALCFPFFSRGVC